MNKIDEAGDGVIEEIIIEAKPQQKNIKRKKSNLTMLFTLNFLPITLSITSIILTLFANFLFYCTAIIAPIVFMAFSISVIIAAIVIETLNIIIKDKTFKFKPQYIMLALAILIACL